MNQLYIILKNEYLTDLKSKSFWISTFLMPVLMMAFGVFIGYISADSEALTKTATIAQPEPDDMSPNQVIAMMVGIFLALFLMIYGSQIFNKVKKEKCNRIVEVLATCVSGQKMMLAKIISVALIGFTQLFLWALILAALVVGVVFIFNVDIPWDEITSMQPGIAILWAVLFFLGGYVFYGTLYAVCGAITDKDGENQSYMTIITFLLLSSFYIGEYAVTNSGTALVTFCSFFPFTAPTIACVNAVSGEVPVWQSILALLVLYGFAYLASVFAGKIYTSSIMMKGKKLSPQDFILFLKMK